MILKKIDKYLTEKRITKPNRGDNERFQKIFQYPPKKAVSFITFTHFEDHTSSEREVDYIPLKKGFQFEYNMDFDPEFADALQFLADSYGMASKSSMERPTNTSIFTATYKGKRKR